MESLGISSATIYRKTKSGEWESRSVANGRGRPIKMIVVESLPAEVREAISDQQSAGRESAPITCSLSPVTSPSPVTCDLSPISALLSRVPLEERPAWIAEINRLALLLERYDAIKPKREKNKSGHYAFVPAVKVICKEAACTDELILKREPRRAEAPAPRTLDGWLREYRKRGLTTFLRSLPAMDHNADRRRAPISSAAVEWINQHYKQYGTATDLYKSVSRRAAKEGWKIPSQTWFFRQWKNLPKVVSIMMTDGAKAYTSKLASYVPRDAGDLEALQIVCGDHSQRDVTVLLRDGSLARPWLTLWQCLRTGLLWGWHLDLTPSSYTAGCAYARGVRAYGAQPLSRPDDDFFSYIYTDQGKDYKSRNWDGQEIAVHKMAMRIEGGIELLRIQRRIGFCEETGVKHLLARGYNAREKPVERTHRVISDWEERTFDEYCGRDAKNKPDLWRQMYADHQLFVRGKRSESPFIGFDEYLDALVGFIHEYNSTPHQRTTLNNAMIVPLVEYQRLYTTRYEIADESLSLLLMQAETRVIKKNGVGCSAAMPGWHYLHPAMSRFKGQQVEVRFDPNDLWQVWVFLPNGQICEAELVEKSSYIKPNARGVKLIKEVQGHERKLIREWSFLNQSMMRGESVEDRVAAQLATESTEEEVEELIEAIAVGAAPGSAGRMPATVQKMTRFDARKLRAVRPGVVTATEISEIADDESIFNAKRPSQIREFDYEE